MTCKDCIHYCWCKDTIADENWNEDAPKEIKEMFSPVRCENFKNKADFVEVVRCKECKHGRLIDKTKSPEKYFKDNCVVCECEDVVGDEPMIYLPTHFCSYGERKDINV